jgi:hypothetical protein
MCKELDRHDIGNCCGCYILTVLTAFHVGAFSSLVYTSRLGEPAVCQDGRLSNTGAKPRVAIDATYRDGPIPLKCLVPIAVYVNDNFPQSPQENLRQDGVQGFRQILYDNSESGVACIPNNASLIARVNNVIHLSFHKTCDEEWTCNHGKCSGYEKALRLCLSFVAREAYECTYIPGKPELGVMTFAKQMNQGIPIFLGLTVLIGACICFVIFDSDSYNYMTFDRIRFYWAAAILIGVSVCSVGIFKSMQTTPKPRLQTVADLTGPCTTGEFHMCGGPSYEEPPWNRSIEPVQYFIMWALLPLVSCCCWPAQLLQHAAYEQARRLCRRTFAPEERSPLV